MFLTLAYSWLFRFWLFWLLFNPKLAHFERKKSGNPAQYSAPSAAAGKYPSTRPLGL